MCASAFAAVADRVSRARDHCVAAVHTDRRPLLVGQQGPHRSLTFSCSCSLPLLITSFTCSDISYDLLLCQMYIVVHLWSILTLVQEKGSGWTEQYQDPIAPQ